MVHALVLGALFAIDPLRSAASFSVAHIFVERVTGTVPIVSGTMDLPDGTTIPTRVEATLDATRFKTDESDRDAAMQGPDWFDTKAFPTWTFTSSKIVPNANGFVMDGLLTIHGVTQPVALVVVVAGAPAHPIYRATAHIDRHAFGMKKTRLDPAIGTIVDVTMAIGLR